MKNVHNLGHAWSREALPDLFLLYYTVLSYRLNTQRWFKSSSQKHLRLLILYSAQWLVLYVVLNANIFFTITTAVVNQNICKGYLSLSILRSFKTWNTCKDFHCQVCFLKTSIDLLDSLLNYRFVHAQIYKRNKAILPPVATIDFIEIGHGTRGCGIKWSLVKEWNACEPNFSLPYPHTKIQWITSLQNFRTGPVFCPIWITILLWNPFPFYMRCPWLCSLPPITYFSFILYSSQAKFEEIATCRL